MQTPKKAVKLSCRTLAITIGLACFVYIGLNIIIGWGVFVESNKAIARFGGERIEALISEVECQRCGIKDRNHAVWALGQLHDKRALPVLRKYYTGKPCDHVRQICQYELSTAIKWTEGNAYMAPQLWRPFL